MRSQVEHGGQRLGRAAVDPQQVAGGPCPAGGRRVEVGERRGQLDKRGALHTGDTSHRAQVIATIDARSSRDAALRAGMYESFYLRAVAPERPLGGVDPLHGPQAARAPPARLGVVHRVRRRPRRARTCTSSRTRSRCPPGGWIAIGESAAGARPRRGAPAARRGGRCSFDAAEPELRHLPRDCAVPRAAAAHEADEPRARRALRRRRSSSAERDARPRRLARDGRPQLGYRARRAVDLAARRRLRGAARGVAGRGARAGARRRAH